MSRSRHAKSGSNHSTRDLVGRGARWQPKTPYYKRLLRRKLRIVGRRELSWLKNNVFSIEFILLKLGDVSLEAS